MREPEQSPHEARRDCLQHGNPSGDLSKAARCGTKTRRGTPCQCPRDGKQAVPSSRQRTEHGAAEGRWKESERRRRAITKHGGYSQAAVAERRFIPGSCSKEMPGDTC